MLTEIQEDHLERARFYLGECLKHQKHLTDNRDKISNYEARLQEDKFTERDCRRLITKLEAIDKRTSPPRSPETTDRFSDLDV